MRADLMLLRALLGMIVTSKGAMRRALYVGMAEEAVAVGLGLATPYLLKAIIEQAPKNAAAPMMVLSAAFVLSWIAPPLIGGLKLGRTVALVDGLYARIADRLLRLELPARTGRGALSEAPPASVLERLPISLQLVLDAVIWRAAPLGAQIVLGLAAIGWVLPLRYPLGLAIVFLGYVVVTDLGAARLSADVARSNSALARHSAALQDLIRNAVRVICNGALTLELQALDARATSRFSAQGRVAQSMALLTVAQSTVLALGLTSVLAVAGFDVAAKRISLGDFVLLQTFAFRIALPLSNLAITLRQCSGPLANIREALFWGGCEAVVRRCDTQPPAVEPSALTLRHVSFTYGAGRFALQDVNLELQPGRLMVLVGGNGSGKSTLARLMAGLLDPTEGEICFGDARVSDLALNQRIPTLLYTPQFITLFDRTIGENGLYPPSRLTEAALAKQLQAWRFSADGTIVDLSRPAGEGGAHLSGGQVQKLELARLSAVDAPVLILDETTSALDAASEADAVRLLRTQFRDRLLVMVTHRQRLAESADDVIFLQAGRVAGVGRHADLLSNAAYRRLWGQ